MKNKVTCLLESKELKELKVIQDMINQISLFLYVTTRLTLAYRNKNVEPKKGNRQVVTVR